MRGSRVALTNLGLAGAFGAVLTAGMLMHPNTSLNCTNGTAPGQVLLYGQRFEAGFTPKGDTPQVIAQHETQGVAVGNAVIAVVCVRPPTAAEQQAAYEGRSPNITNWPLPKR